MAMTHEEKVKRERESVAHKTLQQPPYVEVGSAEEQALLNDYYQEVTNVNEDFVDYVKNHQDIRKKEQYVAKMNDTMNEYYNRRLMMACYAPMVKGINGDTMLEAMGMYAGLYMFSKSFRENVQFKRQSRLIDKLNAKIDKHPDREKLVERRDNLLKDKYGTLPLSPESAACQKIGFAKQAYERMREPGADVKVVQMEYQAAMTALDEQCELYGVSKSERDRSERVIVGQLSKKDPMFQYIYQEFQQGVHQSDSRQELDLQYDEQGNRVINYYERWSGEFEYPDGRSFEGGFTPREPGTRRSYEQSFSDFMYEDVAACENGYELKKFFQHVRGDDVHNAKVDARLAKMEAWRQEVGVFMRADGFNERDIQFAQMMGFADAIFKRDAELKEVDFADMFKDKEAYYRARDAWVSQESQGDVFETRKQADAEFEQRQTERQERGETIWDEIHREQKQSYRQTPWDDTFQDEKESDDYQYM